VTVTVVPVTTRSGHTHESQWARRPDSNHGNGASYRSRSSADLVDILVVNFVLCRIS
jgi:hypothetical protein